MLIGRERLQAFGTLGEWGEPEMSRSAIITLQVIAVVALALIVVWALNVIR
jgi:hypothetical protein